MSKWIEIGITFLVSAIVGGVGTYMTLAGDTREHKYRIGVLESAFERHLEHHEDAMSKINARLDMILQSMGDGSGASKTATAARWPITARPRQ